MYTLISHDNIYTVHIYSIIEMLVQVLEWAWNPAVAVVTLAAVQQAKLTRDTRWLYLVLVHDHLMRHPAWVAGRMGEASRPPQLTLSHSHITNLNNKYHGERVKYTCIINKPDSWRIARMKFVIKLLIITMTQPSRDKKSNSRIRCNQRPWWSRL